MTHLEKVVVVISVFIGIILLMIQIYWLLVLIFMDAQGKVTDIL